MEKDFCKLCNEEVVNPIKHEIRHYADKIGEDALIECPNCYRAFASKIFFKLGKILIKKSSFLFRT